MSCILFSLLYFKQIYRKVQSIESHTPDPDRASRKSRWPASSLQMSPLLIKIKTLSK